MQQLIFKAKGSEYFKIWIVNIMLTIITLGFYYPWAKVRNRRYMYANIYLENRNFEYHATGKQLLLSYIISMFVLIIYYVAQQISLITSVVFLGVALIVIPWLIVKSLMFTMKMSSFSNLRFSFVGSYKVAYINYFLHLLLLLSFGVYFFVASYFRLDYNGFPLGIISSLAIIWAIYYLFFSAYIKKRNFEYFFGNIKYAQESFRTDFKFKDILFLQLKIFLAPLFFFILFSLATTAIIYFLGDGGMMDYISEIKNGTHSMENKSFILIIIGMVYVFFLLLVIAIAAYSTVINREYIFKNIHLGDKVHFKSTLKFPPFLWVIVSNFLLVLITIGLALPWVKVRITRAIIQNTYVDVEDNLDTFIAQKTQEVSAFGSELSDAFDIDISIGM